jgi:hypothetical protein
MVAERRGLLSREKGEPFDVGLTALLGGGLGGENDRAPDALFWG